MTKTKEELEEFIRTKTSPESQLGYDLSKIIFDKYKTLPDTGKVLIGVLSEFITYKIPQDERSEYIKEMIKHLDSYTRLYRDQGRKTRKRKSKNEKK